MKMLCSYLLKSASKSPKEPVHSLCGCKGEILLSLRRCCCYRRCCSIFHFLYLLYSRHITLFVAECVNSRFSSAPYKINNFISLADLFYLFHSFVRWCVRCAIVFISIQIYSCVISRYSYNCIVRCIMVCHECILLDVVVVLLHLVRNTVSMEKLLLKHEHETFCICMCTVQYED